MKWFAVFKTGKHTDSAGNEKEWTEADLDKIANGYDPKKHEAPIVIGHPKTNAPAFGWVEKLKRVGDTLYALPKQLANDFVEMVNKGLFKKRSISLYPDGTLRHVGFLGAQPPAVKGLPDVEFKEDENLSTIETEGASDFDEQPAENNLKELEDKVKQYELQLKKMNEKEKEFEELQTKYAQVLVEKSTLEKEIQKQKRESQLKEFSEIVDKAIAEGKLLPKMKDTITKLYEVVSLTPVYEFSEGVKTQPSQLLNELIDYMPKIIDFGESGKQGEKKEDDLPASKIVAEEIRKQMKN
ncbi:MAG: hypothetical protein ACOYWZ_07325 [Bacillota bacterium]